MTFTVHWIQGWNLYWAFSDRPWEWHGGGQRFRHTESKQCRRVRYWVLHLRPWLATSVDGEALCLRLRLVRHLLYSSPQAGRNSAVNFTCDLNFTFCTFIRSWYPVFRFNWVRKKCGATRWTGTTFRLPRPSWRDSCHSVQTHSTWYWDDIFQGLKSGRKTLHTGIISYNKNILYGFCYKCLLAKIIEFVFSFKMARWKWRAKVAGITTTLMD